MTTTVAGLIAGRAVVVGLVAEHVGRGWEQPAWIPIFDLAMGWSMVGAGLAASLDRPSRSRDGAWCAPVSCGSSARRGRPSLPS